MNYKVIDRETYYRKEFPRTDPGFREKTPGVGQGTYLLTHPFAIA